MHVHVVMRMREGGGVGAGCGRSFHRRAVAKMRAAKVS